MRQVEEPFAANFLVVVYLLLLWILSTPLHSADYRGSEKCASCHEEEFGLWRESHHYQAMLAATAETVLGDFPSQETLLVRQGQLDQAISYLARAAELDSMNIRYIYVYAVALYENKQQEEAIAVLEAALENHPGSRELISALASYYQERGEEEKLQKLVP